MDVDVAYSEVIPRFVDLALFLCGTALRDLRAELRTQPHVAQQLYEWYLYKICFLHALPNDHEAKTSASASDGGVCHTEGATARMHESSPLPPPTPAAAVGDITDGGEALDCGSNNASCFTGSFLPSGKEVSFRSAAASLRGGLGALQQVHLADEESTGQTLSGVGQVHPRASPDPAHRAAPDVLEAPPADVGFALISGFLSAACHIGGDALSRRLAEALLNAVRTRDVISMHNDESNAAAEAVMNPPSAPSSSTSSHFPTVSVAGLSQLFDADLLEDEWSCEAGNATRSYHIWVNYEWASASFPRQALLARLVSQWMRELAYYQHGRRDVVLRMGMNANPATAAALTALPTNLRNMYAALEGVFEGHAGTRSLLMELALAHRTPHLPDNALAKLLFQQGPSVSASMSRAELANRGTQPILMCITSGMLLYAQYYLSFRSLTVARQCVRVALQVAQEVHSNTVLALAHYTAHVVALHQGRPADAANSISIALQLTLPSALAESTIGYDDGADASAATVADTEGQMASVAFVGAAQLLLFFPGAVGPALRSVLSTGRLAEGAGGVAGGGGGVEGREEGGDGAGRLKGASGAAAAGGGGGGAVLVQTVAQSIQHALLRAETSLLQSAPAEGRWVNVVAQLQRETHLLIGALYGIVSCPRWVDAATLGDLLTAVRAESRVASPLFAMQPTRTLFWEALRHTAHHALSLTEQWLARDAAETVPASTKALQCLSCALEGIRQHYGTAGITAATDNVFFVSAVRYCAACQLQHDGHATAAYALLTTVADALHHAAGMGDAAQASSYNQPQQQEHSAATAARNQAPFRQGEEVDGAVFTDAALDWPPDHLLLYALVQRRRALVAAFLGYVAVPPRVQQALLTVSARYSFVFGVLTSQLMEGELHHQRGRYSAALTAARRVEASACRIGFPSVCEAAQILQVAAHCSSGEWLAARVVLARIRGCRATTHQVFLRVHQLSVHVKLLQLAQASSRDVQSVARNWLAMVKEEPWTPSEQPGMSPMSLVDRVCLLSALLQAGELLGNDVCEQRKQLHVCLLALEQRQCAAVRDAFLHGDCEEVCRHALACVE